jgi:hypothetical protein
MVGVRGGGPMGNGDYRRCEMPINEIDGVKCGYN